MGISATELALQRKLTKNFIKADSMNVVLMRSPMVSDGEGGTTRGAPVPLPVQVMRLIPAQDGAPERLTSDGVQISPKYMLMGVWDADMDRWDRFTVAGQVYEVVSVNQNLQYETKGEVAYLG
jgi:hypothetical protein